MHILTNKVLIQLAIFLISFSVIANSKLNKTLSSNNQINTILSEENSQMKVLNIAFHYDRPPYMFGKTSSKGIEADLVKEIFRTQGYKINIFQFPKESLENILKSNINFDGVASVSHVDDEMFSSNKYSLYEDFAITRMSDALIINSLEDLTKHDFVSWKNAFNDLGDNFFRYFNPENGTHRSKYHDRASQKDQTTLFFEKKIDVVIIDKMIFKWYESHAKTNEKYTFHNILPLASNSISRFRSKEVRDAFNRGLDVIKKNGVYQRVIDFYLTKDIKPLLIFSNLIADISGRFLYSDKHAELKSILSKFMDNSAVVAIDVFDKAANKNVISLINPKLISNGKHVENVLNFSEINKKIFFINNENPLKVGNITIY